MEVIAQHLALRLLAAVTLEVVQERKILAQAVPVAERELETH